MLVGTDPERRRQAVGPPYLNLNSLLIGFDFGLFSNLARHGSNVERLHFQARHIALELGNGIQIIDDVDQTVDALLGPFEVFTVDQVVLQTTVEQCRNIPLNIENRGFQLMGHITQILLAERFRFLEPRDLLVVGIRPGGQLLGNVFDVLVLELIQNLLRMHVTRKYDRVDRLQLISHVLANNKQRQ